MITWIDKKSVLSAGKKKFKAGDVIPAGILSPERIESLVRAKKLRLGEVKAAPVKKFEIMGVSIPVKTVEPEPEPVLVETPEPEPVIEQEEKKRGRKKGSALDRQETDGPLNPLMDDED